MPKNDIFVVAVALIYTVVFLLHCCYRNCLLLTNLPQTDNIFVYVKCVIIKNSKQCKTLTENGRDPLKAP